MVSVLIEHIVTEKAPLPRGHYAQATKANGFVFVSGQLPLTTDGDAALAEGLEAQVHQALTNVREVLLAAGTDVGRLLSVQIYVSDIEIWPRVNSFTGSLLATRRRLERSCSVGNCTMERMWRLVRSPFAVTLSDQGKIDQIKAASSRQAGH